MRVPATCAPILAAQMEINTMIISMRLHCVQPAAKQSTAISHVLKPHQIQTHRDTSQNRNSSQNQQQSAVNARMPTQVPQQPAPTQ